MSQQKLVAIACETADGVDGNVSGHFGHTPFFVVAEIDGAKVSSTRLIQSPGHGQGCSMPQFVAQLGVRTLVVGGLGARAEHMLWSLGIEVLAGITGSVKDALGAAAAGTLQGRESTCSGHSEGHSCRHRHDWP